MNTTTLKALATELDMKPLAEIAAGRTTANLSACGWHIDFSRQFMDSRVDDALFQLAADKSIEQSIEDLFSAVKVNPSEDRPALHWALRLQKPASNVDVEFVRQSLTPALDFADKVRSEGKYKAVVHIGIGGSDFGPRLLFDAFPEYQSPNIDLRFCSNVDPLDLERALNGLDPATTLVIGVSKSFGTEETLYNLGRAKDWLAAHIGDKWPEQLALVTANPTRATAWLGQDSEQLFHLPESVGGRFSLWSTASLACMIACGSDWFKAFLKGANGIDEHVKTAPISENMAVRLALLDYWNATVRGEEMRVVLGYSNRLRMLPTYLQQLEMESNGKSVSPMGDRVADATAPAVWGGEGSVGQHSYHQWLHQGTNVVATEFILATDTDKDENGNTALIAHALAQAEVLANGRQVADIQADEPNLDQATANQKVHNGGRPSTMFMTSNLTPEKLGALIALFEHRVYVSGKLWGINSFDQWGVERGKTMAGRLKSALNGDANAEDHVTARLIDTLKTL